MTMIVFDYSDIKARMERRAPTKPVEYQAVGHWPLGDAKCKIPLVDLTESKTVNIYVQHGVDARAFIRTRAEIARALSQSF